MAERTIKTRIGLRRDTEANWNALTNFNPIRGEVCLIETSDGLKMKIGDGETLFQNLPYIIEEKHYSYDAENECLELF